MCYASTFRKISIIITVLLVCSCGDSKQKNANLDQIDRSLCNFLVSSCLKEANGAEIALFITPNTVPSEQDLSINLKSNKSITIKSARIEGRDMFMGIIPVTTNSLNDKDFSSKAILGSCASGYMVWRLFVTYELNGQTSTVFYDFLADNG
ncbi:hypothetical protein JQC92_11535 [Shewanella sp. 202IG2-18]|uniref:hypothetical protein n=1 Tax=Parashewanella hymeniacidonis TaxID=2807618 RepID=UPI0019609ACE|nr:hypothetical protein [Parashewanella hymeniacidonis]MBM7072653.1 hypothetical protein [Parashewanella hymeniacidonis]